MHVYDSDGSAVDRKVAPQAVVAAILERDYLPVRDRIFAEYGQEQFTVASVRFDLVRIGTEKSVQAGRSVDVVELLKTDDIDSFFAGMQQDVVQDQTHFLMDGSRIQRHNFHRFACGGRRGRVLEHTVQVPVVRCDRQNGEQQPYELSFEDQPDNEQRAEDQQDGDRQTQKRHRRVNGRVGVRYEISGHRNQRYQADDQIEGQFHKCSDGFSPHGATMNESQI